MIEKDTPEPGAPTSELTVGDRIRALRKDAGLTLSGLAERSGLSKSYLSSLENNEGSSRPSGNTLYQLAEALGVTMSELLGKKVLTDTEFTPIPPSLEEFALAENLEESDKRMLAAINFRGKHPNDKDSWAFVWQAIRRSVGD